LLPENFDRRNKEKTEKCTITGFEVSSKDYISPRNHGHLNTLHKSVTKNITRSQFKENLSSLAWYDSYQIWLPRKKFEFLTISYLTPHHQ
jgi:hypothetical protein